MTMTTRVEDQRSTESVEAPNGRNVETLRATQNPALARVARAVEERESASGPENYSRMHHRHNRD